MEAISDSGSASEGFVKIGDGLKIKAGDKAVAKDKLGLLEGEKLINSHTLVAFECPQLGFTAEFVELLITNFRILIRLEDESALYNMVANVPLTCISRITPKGYSKASYTNIFYSQVPDFRLEIRTKDCRLLILRFALDQSREDCEKSLRERAFFLSNFHSKDEKALAELKARHLFAFEYYKASPKPRRHSANAGSSPVRGSLMRAPTGSSPPKNISSQRRASGSQHMPRSYFYDVHREWRRLNGPGSGFSVSNHNVGYQLCKTYPELIMLPDGIDPDVAKKSAQFRSSCRLPAICWFNSATGVTLSRCSQPQTGVTTNSTADEAVVSKLHSRMTETPIDDDQSVYIPSANASKSILSNTSSVYKQSFGLNSTVTQRDKDKDKVVKLTVIDARSKTAAAANMIKGGGYENEDLYEAVKIKFMDIGNIHEMRSSHSSYVDWMVGATPYDRIAIEHTSWPSHCRKILEAASYVAEALINRKQSVLVHCSDGWDRTSQIVSLAQLMIDPYFRTREGFAILIQKEWLGFGHKFFDRLGHGLSPDQAQNKLSMEESPIFLQWMEAVFQLLDQFPNWFEFNETFLLYIVDEMLACRYGDFIANNERESKLILNLSQNTLSVWDYLFDPSLEEEFDNPDYVENSKLIKPQTSTSHFQTWSAFYERYRLSMVPTHEYVESTRRAKTGQKHEVEVLSQENKDLKDRLEGAEALLKELLQKDPGLLKGVQEKLQKLKPGADLPEIGFNIMRNADGTMSAQLRDKKPTLSLSQEFVGARKLVGGKLDMIADDYLGAPEHPVILDSDKFEQQVSSSEESSTLDRSDITSDLNKSFLRTARDDSQIIRDDYLSNEAYADNLDAPASPQPRVVSRVRIRDNDQASSWNYNYMKKFVSGYFPRSYLSAIRVLAEIPNSFYVTVSLEKISEWIASINRQG